MEEIYTMIWEASVPSMLSYTFPKMSPDTSEGGRNKTTEEEMEKEKEKEQRWFIYTHRTFQANSIEQTINRPSFSYLA